MPFQYPPGSRNTSGLAKSDFSERASQAGPTFSHYSRLRRQNVCSECGSIVLRIHPSRESKGMRKTAASTSAKLISCGGLRTNSATRMAWQSDREGKQLNVFPPSDILTEYARDRYSPHVVARTGGIKNAQRLGCLCCSVTLMRRGRLSESRPSDRSSNEPVSPSAMS